MCLTGWLPWVWLHSYTCRCPTWVRNIIQISIQRQALVSTICRVTGFRSMLAKAVAEADSYLGTVYVRRYVRTQSPPTTKLEPQPAEHLLTLLVWSLLASNPKLFHPHCDTYTGLFSRFFPVRIHIVNMSLSEQPLGANADEIWRRYESEIRFLYQTQSLDEVKRILEAKPGFPKMA
jgi:hypothetical protein